MIIGFYNFPEKWLVKDLIHFRNRVQKPLEDWLCAILNHRIFLLPLLLAIPLHNLDKYWDCHYFYWAVLFLRGVWNGLRAGSGCATLIMAVCREIHRCSLRVGKGWTNLCTEARPTAAVSSPLKEWQKKEENQNTGHPKPQTQHILSETMCSPPSMPDPIYQIRYFTQPPSTSP